EMVRHPSGKPDYRWAKTEAVARRADVARGDGSRVAAWQLAELQPSGAWGATRRLASAVRALIDRVVAADASDDAQAAALAGVAEMIEAQTARLAALPAKGTRAAFRDGSYQGRQALFMDRGPLIGLSNPLAPPMVLSAEGTTAIGRVTFGPAFEGAPGFLHGGFLAAAFDQVFGYLGVLRGIPALTGSLTVRYRKPTPLGVELRFEASAERSEGRKSFVRGRCLAGDEVTGEAEALFVAIGA